MKLEEALTFLSTAFLVLHLVLNLCWFGTSISFVSGVCRVLWLLSSCCQIPVYLSLSFLRLEFKVQKKIKKAYCEVWMIKCLRVSLNIMGYELLRSWRRVLDRLVRWSKSLQGVLRTAIVPGHFLSLVITPTYTRLAFTGPHLDLPSWLHSFHQSNSS